MAFEFKADGGGTYPLTEDDVQGLSDRLPMRGVDITYLNRDGGDIQDQGVGIAEHRFNCFFSGEDYADRYRALVEAIERQRRGLLTHPLLGPRRAFCSGIDSGTVDFFREMDTVVFTIGFKRDETNTTLQAGRAPSVQKKAAQLDLAVQSTRSQVDALLDTALQAEIPKVPTLLDTATQFRLAALAALAERVTSFAFEDWRGKLRTAVGEAMTQVRALGFPDAATQPIIAQIAAVAASSEELDLAVRTEGPQITTITVQQHQPVGTVAVQYYGPDGRDKIDEIRRNNRLRGMGVGSGQRLRLIGTTRGGPR